MGFLKCANAVSPPFANILPLLPLFAVIFYGTSNITDPVDLIILSRTSSKVPTPIFNGIPNLYSKTNTMTHLGYTVFLIDSVLQAIGVSSLIKIVKKGAKESDFHLNNSAIFLKIFRVKL